MDWLELLVSPCRCLDDKANAISILGKGIIDSLVVVWELQIEPNERAGSPKPLQSKCHLFRIWIVSWQLVES